MYFSYMYNIKQIAALSNCSFFKIIEQKVVSHKNKSDDFRERKNPTPEKSRQPEHRYSTCNLTRKNVALITNLHHPEKNAQDKQKQNLMRFEIKKVLGIFLRWLFLVLRFDRFFFVFLCVCGFEEILSPIRCELASHLNFISNDILTTIIGQRHESKRTFIL